MYLNVFNIATPGIARRATLDRYSGLRAHQALALAVGRIEAGRRP
ncbi:hypothetical protein [Kitasatospora sp. NPDC096204]